MGKIKRGILGGVSGKVANVVGGSWKGTDYLRALPTSVANPRTPGQQNQRGKFTQSVEFAQKILTPIITPFWNQFGEGQSGYNLFISRNISVFDQNSLQNPQNLKTTIGNITPAPISSLNITTGADEVDVSWSNNSGQGNAQGTDEAIVVARNEATGEITSTVKQAQRSATSLTADLPATSSGDSIQVWLSFVNGDNEPGEPDYQDGVAP